MTRLLIVAALLGALAAPSTAAAYTGGACDPSGDVPANAVRACEVFGQVTATLVYKRWPAARATGWDCTYRSDYPRTLLCRLDVYRGRVRHYPYLVAWRNRGGRCTYRASTDDLTFRVAFGARGCLTASRRDV